MSNKDFKVMFVSLNDRMRTFIPTSISCLSAALKEAGFSTCLFDTSFYAEQERIQEEKKKEDAGIFEPVDYASIGVFLKEQSLLDDLLAAVEKEQPQLIAFSVFSQSKSQNYEMAEVIKKHFPEIPIIFGGIHINVYPREVLTMDFVDYICVGEGEEAIVELAACLAAGDRPKTVKNIGWKEEGVLHINKLRPPTELSKLSFPDWDLFEPYHLYGPFRGKLLKMALVEYSRTCPYNCAYCGNATFKQHYRDSGHGISYRHKTPRQWVNELSRMKNEYGIEFINIIDGTFVAQSEKNLEELAEYYTAEIGLPFFCDATVRCVTPKKARLLKKMGCICVNMGVEAGNEEYRKKYLNRTMTNEKIVEAFHIVKEHGMEARSYNIIGLPYQTRENIMETVELNRKAGSDSVSMSIFMPYDGTVLRQVCIDDGLVDPAVEITGDGTDPIIHNPNLTDEELMGLYNTFALYVTAPRELFPEIRKAEADTPEAMILRNKIRDKINTLKMTKDISGINRTVPPA